jgi:hypothetical protein
LFVKTLAPLITLHKKSSASQALLDRLQTRIDKRRHICTLVNTARFGVGDSSRLRDVVYTRGPKCRRIVISHDLDHVCSFKGRSRGLSLRR